MSTPRSLHFYFDFSCPYAYIASTQLDALCERVGADRVDRPVLLGGIFRAVDTPQIPAAAMPPSKARHNALDISRWAAYRGVTLNVPARHPMRTVEALRLLLASPEGAWPRLIAALFGAYWVAGQAIDDTVVLAGVATQQGLDGAALVERLGDDDLKRELRRRTDQAIERGVFGVPTFFVENEIYYGQDRLRFVERHLSGERVPGTSELARFGVN